MKKVREENLRVLKSTQLITRQNIQTLANTLKRALLTRSEKEILSSEYGKIQVNKLWNLGRTQNRKLFQREIQREDTDFAVEILIDASGSQQGRQSQVALQGYILSEALSIAGIPHRVTGFCTLGAYTVLTMFRDFEEDREMNRRIFEFYGSANNRDGLAVRTAAAGLDQRKEENKILVVLSDGRPNDIMAGSQSPGYTLPGAKKQKKNPTVWTLPSGIRQERSADSETGELPYWASLPEKKRICLRRRKFLERILPISGISLILPMWWAAI